MNDAAFKAGVLVYFGYFLTRLHGIVEGKRKEHCHRRFFDEWDRKKMEQQERRS